MTKAMMFMSAAMATMFAVADGMSLADARKQIADCISNPATMTAVVKQLSAADQRTYLGDVVAAVAKLPGSKNEAAAAYVSVSRAALKGSSQNNVANMIAEVFATIPPEYLPAVSESLSSDMLNRASDPSKTYTDNDYLGIATNVMAVVNERTASADAPDVRSAFAALAFIRGANSANENVVSAMVAALPESARQSAAKEWFPSALAEGDGKSYDAMLVAASVDDDMTPDELTGVLLRIPGPQAGDVLLSDLSTVASGGSSGASGRSPLPMMPIFDATVNPVNESLPELTGAATETAIEEAIKEAEREQNPEPGPGPNPEPGPYQGQTTGL